MLFPVLANEVSGPSEDKITFAGDSAYPPFEWLDNGKAKGFNIDLAEQISQAGGIPVEYKLGRWNEVLNALESGEVDAVAMFISEERKNVFRFTTPFYVVSHAIYGQKDRPPVIGVHDLTGFRIAVEKSSIAHGQLINEEFDIDIVLVASTPQALQAVAVGIADFAVLAEPTAEHLITTQNLPLERASPPFWPRDYAFAVRRDRDELFLWLQGALNLATRVFMKNGNPIYTLAPILPLKFLFILATPR